MVSPKDFVKPLSLVMDDRGSQSHPRSSGLRVSAKTKAPSPPGLKKLDSSGFSQWHPGNPHLTMDQKENLIDKELSLTVVLPGGVEKTAVVHGSEPLMDLLVMLCAKYHLNPSSHTLELITSNRNNIKLKPNALIGTLDAEKIILKPKGEDANKKTGPQMPEATVRMVINYRKTQKTILRVNPRVPLWELIPAICEKCEFDTETTVLLRDVTSLAPLDLSNSLNDHGIREVYAKDTKRQAASLVHPNSPTSSGAVTPSKDKNQKEKENKGLFSMFRKSKKKAEKPTTASAPASPVLVSKPRPLSMALPCSDSASFSSPLFADVPKKRRAPQPPVLVSQGFHSDFRGRRRLHSEPNPLPDGDQVAGVSRGSSAESSLRRTKRRAPPPPSSPGPVLQETVSDDLQVTVAANTLQEIMEQEETSGPVASAAACSTQGEFSSLNVSSEVSLHSPSPDVASQSTVKEIGEDQSPDLSSDGNLLESIVNGSAAPSEKKINVTDSPEPAVTNSGPLEDSPQSICVESAAESAKGDRTVTIQPLPQKKDAEVQASNPANTESLQELTDGLESSATAGTLSPTGEDAQVQTDFTRFSAASPQRQEDKVPSSANSLATQTVEKKDIATLTEELEPSDLKHASFQSSSCQDSTPSVPATLKASPMYATNSEPKPKPSNELTRDYIPKVGMTTYTIVPQKSQDKLRYFEVALTLQAASKTPVEGLDIGSLDLNENTGQKGQTEISKEKCELGFNLPRDDLLTSTVTSTTTTTTTSTTTAATQHTVDGSIPTPTYSSSPTALHSPDKIFSSANPVSPPGSPAEVKEMKIPPATRPKPASFRLAQHKKTPGYYVTSAAEKSLGASPGSALKETRGSAEGPALPPPPSPSFPPPPPPVQFREEAAEATNVQRSPQWDDKNVSSMRMTRQSSLPSREPSAGLSLEKLRSFAAPRPFAPPTPSRFAQAVSSAVKRSQSLPHGPKLPPSSVVPPVSPITSHSSALESDGLSKLESEEVVQTRP
ncbi:cordon-bleu protein-like 1b isoform X2 [Kryptolebias marmoratus]|uniref:cordon-bleu protein-like 1b isoform X2 n=1 Tax=Kryptolebias marmoratus TaxID=37003 RepID=UPI0007F9391E|nr:cordon-bleu protein-like 1b isoform X2 [Kryptolebias marmoratus]